MNECGCRIERFYDQAKHEQADRIHYCRLHDSAEIMLTALMAVRDGWEHNLSLVMRTINLAIKNAEGR